MRTPYCRYGFILRVGSEGLRAAPLYSFSEKVCQAWAGGSGARHEIMVGQTMTCCFMGCLLVLLICSIAPDRALLGRSVLGGLKEPSPLSISPQLH